MNRQSEEMTTNPSLLLRVRDARDGSAWGEFVETYTPMIFSYCRLRQLQESDAADVTQEVLIRLAIALRQFEYNPEIGRFRDWLGVVTHRELLRFWNRRRPMHSLEFASGDGSQQREIENQSLWNDHFHAELLRIALERVRSEFNDETWKAFYSSWIDNRPATLVADQMNIGIERVYVSKSKVLKRLREEVLRLNDDLPIASQ